MLGTVLLYYIFWPYIIMYCTLYAVWWCVKVMIDDNPPEPVEPRKPVEPATPMSEAERRRRRKTTLWHKYGHTNGNL